MLAPSGRSRLPPALLFDALEPLHEVAEPGLEAARWAPSSASCARRSAWRASMKDEVIDAVRMLRKAMPEHHHGAHEAADGSAGVTSP